MLSHSGLTTKAIFSCPLPAKTHHSPKQTCIRVLHYKREAVINWFVNNSSHACRNDVKRSLFCSISDGYSDEPWEGCFSSDSTVKLQKGVDLQVRNLQIGDMVQVMTQEGQIGYSEVVMFADYKPDIPHASHVLIETGTPSKQITLTSSHLIFTSNSTGTRLYSKQAGNVWPGEFLLVSSHGELVPSRVKRVSLVKRTGMVAPVTMHGNIIVDGVLSSCYAMITDHEVAHMVFGPLRIVHNYASSLWSTDWTVQQGMHWYPRILMKINQALGLFELS